MQKLFITILSFSTLISAASAEDINGQSLHQSQCIECHGRMTGGDGIVIYERKDSLVNSYDQLSERVSHCAQGAKAGWETSEIALVTDFLNNQYYGY